MNSRRVAIDGGFEPIFKLRTLIDFWQLFTGEEPAPSRAGIILQSPRGACAKRIA
jgi:hypothetical protein